MLITYINIEEIESILIKKFIHQTDQKIANEIQLKKTTTLALAIATAQDKRLQEYLQKKRQNLSLLDLSYMLRRYTRFKNIHFTLLDPQSNIVYATKSCQKLLHLPAPYQGDIIRDCYGLHFAALVPLKGDRVVGYLEVLSQFNSIVKDLKGFGIDAAVVLNKKLSADTKELSLSIDGYKIVNQNSTQMFLKLLYNFPLEQLLTSSKPFSIAGKILYRYPLYDHQGEIIGWVVYAKNRDLIYANFINRAVLVRLAFLVLLFAAALFVVIYLVEQAKAKEQQKQLRYLYNILDNLEEIVIITNGKKMEYANRAFFRYFDGFTNIDDFLLYHSCICDFFAEEKGFLTAKIENKSWIEYVLEHKNRNIYVKLVYKDKEAIFQVKANKINTDEYVVIFINVTQEYQKEQELRTMATIDPLTKLYNRYYFEKIAKKKMEEALLTGSFLLFAMIDIDHFKAINDTYGHRVGDEVLKEVAATIRKRFRQSDPIFRIGGEEFLIILQTSSIERVLQLLEELREEIASKDFAMIPKHITISIGVAMYQEGDSVQYLYEKADKALYQAKKEGRNRLIFTGGERNG